MKKGDSVICNTIYYKGFTNNKEYVIENICILNSVEMLETINDEGILFYLPSYYFDLVKRSNYGPTVRKNLMRTLFNS